MDPLRDFYKSNAPDLTPISDLRFRHFRLRLRGGRFLKIQRKITSPKMLSAYLARYCPADVYYSTCTWLNPGLLGRKTGDDTLANLFIRGDLAFDVDEKPFTRRNIERARKNTVRLYERLLDMGKRVKYVAFSGGKGFHIVCEDDGRYEGMPGEREAQALEYRRRLVDELEADGLKFDAKITVDTRRILRVPGTVNNSTGYLCTVISAEQLVNDDAGRMLKYLPRVKDNPPLTSALRWDDLCFQQIRTITGWLRRKGVRPHPTEYYESSLSSSVPGLKRQILIIRHPRAGPKRMAKIKESLAAIQGDYGVGDLHLFATDTDFYAVSLRTFDFERAGKILKAAGGESHGSFVKYAQTYMRVGLKRGRDGAEFGERLRYLGTMGHGSGNYYVSRPHHMFFKANGVPLPDYDRMHGAEEVVINHVLME